MTADPASLLGLPVRHRDLRLGTVADVLLSRDDEKVIAMIVRSAWAEKSYVLPRGAATIRDDAVETSPFGLLSSTEAEYYRQRGRTLVGERGT